MPASSFTETVYDFYHANKRDLPWRRPLPDGSFDPYQIMVSEIMLQQTQVPRVIEKFRLFIELFPTIHDLAEAPLQDVLAAWSGLGYNRRARYLREAAKTAVSQYQGTLPSNTGQLVALPGIGPNTAAAILVYSYNQPLVFIETNIRSVYLHHFFADDYAIDDKQILEQVAATIDRENPREWYWALMDYGTFIKKAYGNPNRRSKHHSVQSTFEGSERQLRGRILRELADGAVDYEVLKQQLADDRFKRAVTSLIKDGLLEKHGTKITIAA